MPDAIEISRRVRPRRLHETLMALGHKGEHRTRPLSATAYGMFLLLAELGGNGIYPSDFVVASILGVGRSSAFRARAELAKLGLVTFSDVGKTTAFAISPFPDPPKAQLDAVREFLRAQDNPIPQVFPAPPIEEVVLAAPAVEVPAEVPPAAPAAPVDTPAAAPAEPPPELIPQSAPQSTRKIRRIEMLPEMMEWFCSSPDNMDLYLRFGKGAYGKSRQEAEVTLPPGTTDWLQFRPLNDPNFTEKYPYSNLWKAPHFVGFYWHGVSRWRAAAGVRLTFPRIPRILGDIQGMLQNATPYNVYVDIYAATNHFDLMKFRVGTIANDWILDEATLGHSLIRSEMLNFSSHGEHWIGTEYARMTDHFNKQRERDYHV